MNRFIDGQIFAVFEYHPGILVHNSGTTAIKISWTEAYHQNLTQIVGIGC